VTGIYEQDYISAWDAILSDLELTPFANVQETADGLAILSGPTSPLRSLLQTVSENTSFVEAPEDPNAAKTIAGTVSSARRSVSDRLGKMFPGQITGGLSVTPGARITAHFQPIHRLLAGAPGSAPIDAILTRLGELQQQLRALGPEVGGGDPLQALSNPTLRDTFRLLQQESEALPPSIRPLVAQIGSRSEGSLVRGAADDLEARYQTQVLRPCTDLVAGRYPFMPGSQREVPMTDFGRIFGHGGVFDTFFTANLEQLVDTTHTPWTWRAGVHSLPGVLEQFEAARRVRDVFFASGSQRPDLRFNVTLTELSSAATRFLLDVEGQRFEYRRDGRSGGAGVWPGPEPGFVAAVFEERSGIPTGPRQEGHWALFRFIDGAQPVVESDTRTGLTIQGGRHRARVVIESTTLQNPFMKRAWQRFSCGS
jgi:type VI secretion system protein ImpL